MDKTVTGKTLYFCYLTYGSRTVNKMDSPYQTIMASWERLLGRIPNYCYLRFSRIQHPDTSDIFNDSDLEPNDDIDVELDEE